jgi:hypothetical protein
MATASAKLLRSDLHPIYLSGAQQFQLLQGLFLLFYIFFAAWLLGRSSLSVGSADILD